MTKSAHRVPSAAGRIGFRRRHATFVLLVLSISCKAPTALAAEAAGTATAPSVSADDWNWPEFRGPKGDGRSLAKGLPATWSEDENIVWKTAIHGKGWSTPVVHSDRVWLTTATEDGREMFLLSLDRNRGTILHDLCLFRNESPQALGNPVNSYASPSPAVDGERVYAHFGSYGTACVSTATGRLVWERRDFPCDHFRGPGSSVFLYEDLVVLTFDGFDVQYLVALEKRTGKTVWKTTRSFDFGDMDGDIRKAYSTPIVADFGSGPLLISSGAEASYAYDPRTGRELWRVRYDGYSNAARPVAAAGLVLINTGFGKADLLAVRPDGAGDISETHIAWKSTQGIPLKPSIVAEGDLLFMAAETGIASCLEAKTGEAAWRQRLGGEYSASPILAEGRVYFPSEDGTTVVVEASRNFKVLARNRLAEGCMASPAVSGRSIILRTRTHVYRIETPDSKRTEPLR